MGEAQCLRVGCLILVTIAMVSGYTWGKGQAVCCMVFSGVLERFPKLKVCFGHEVTYVGGSVFEGGVLKATVGIVGMQQETAQAMCCMIFVGVLERLPKHMEVSIEGDM